MLRWSAIFLLIAIVAAGFGFGGIASGAADIVKIFFYLFIAVFVSTLVLGITAGKKIRGT